MAAQSKLKGPPPYTGMYETWDPIGESECKKEPPNIPTNGKCEITSCDQKSFAKDGQPLSGEDALKAALCTDWLNEIKANKFSTPFPPFNPTKDPQGNCPDDPDFWFINGIDQGEEDVFKEVLCTAWIKDKEEQSPPYTNNPLDKAITTPECDERQFWFVDGIDYKNQSAFNARLLEKASEKCAADREKDRESGFEGKWGPREGPGVCAEDSYICDKKIVSEYEYYKTCGLEPLLKCKSILEEPVQACIDYELSDYLYKKCGPRPKDPKPKNCRFVGQGKPKDKESWDKTPQCGDWARCMNLY